MGEPRSHATHVDNCLRCVLFVVSVYFVVVVVVCLRACMHMCLYVRARVCVQQPTYETQWMEFLLNFG